MELGGIVVDLGILPPVAQVRLVGIVYDQAVAQKDPEPLGRQPVVLVDLGDPLREVVHHMVDGMAQRHFNERVIREHAGDLAPERLVHAVVVVGVEESSLLQVATQGLGVLVREMDVAVPRHIKVGDVPQLGAGERDYALARGDGESGALPNRGEEVGQFGRSGVPVAAAIIVQAADGERGETRNSECGMRNGRAEVGSGDSAFRIPLSAFGSAGERYQECAHQGRQAGHRSFTNRYAVFFVIPVSAASWWAASRLVIPWASSVRARASGSVEGSARAGLPVPATTTVTSPRGGAAA